MHDKRILRNIDSGDSKNLEDRSTLLNPSVVNEIKTSLQ